MDLAALRSFLAVVDHQHFGRAAESLLVAQPALSRQIARLEKELGVRLFTRTTRRVEITEPGRRLETHARALLAGADELVLDMQLLAGGVRGRVAVGFVGTATYDVLPRVANAVREQLPDVELEVRGELLSPVLLDGLADRTFDLAVLRLGPDTELPEGLRARTLRTERLVAALPRCHRLAHRRRIDLAELAGDPFVTHPSGRRSAFQQTVIAACARAGFVPRVELEASETATLMVYVAAGMGVALVPEPVRSLALDDVRYVPLGGRHTTTLSLVARRDELSPTAGTVAGIITDCAS